VTSGGRLFQRRLPATGNARSPTVDSRIVRQIISCEDNDDRRRRRAYKHAAHELWRSAGNWRKSQGNCPGKRSRSACRITSLYIRGCLCATLVNRQTDREDSFRRLLITYKPAEPKNLKPKNGDWDLQENARSRDGDHMYRSIHHSRKPPAASKFHASVFCRIRLKIEVYIAGIGNFAFFWRKIVENMEFSVRTGKYKSRCCRWKYKKKSCLQCTQKRTQTTL